MYIYAEAFRNLERLPDEAKKSLASKELEKPVEYVEHVRFTGIEAGLCDCKACFSALVAGLPYTFMVPCDSVDGTFKEKSSTKGYEWVQYY